MVEGVETRPLSILQSGPCCFDQGGGRWQGPRARAVLVRRFWQMWSHKLFQLKTIQIFPRNNRKKWLHEVSTSSPRTFLVVLERSVLIFIRMMSSFCSCDILSQTKITSFWRVQPLFVFSLEILRQPLTRALLPIVFWIYFSICSCSRYKLRALNRVHCAFLLFLDHINVRQINKSVFEKYILYPPPVPSSSTEGSAWSCHILVVQPVSLTFLRFHEFFSFSQNSQMYSFFCFGGFVVYRQFDKTWMYTMVVGPLLLLFASTRGQMWQSQAPPLHRRYF